MCFMFGTSYLHVNISGPMFLWFSGRTICSAFALSVTVRIADVIEFHVCHFLLLLNCDGCTGDPVVRLQPSKFSQFSVCRIAVSTYLRFDFHASARTFLRRSVLIFHMLHILLRPPAFLIEYRRICASDSVFGRAGTYCTPYVLF